MFETKLSMPEVRTETVPLRSTAGSMIKRSRNMANADKKHLGPGAQEKRAGNGGLTDIPREMVGENQVPPNRDKKQHSHERGQDSKEIQTEQLQDSATNRLPENKI